MQDLHNRGRDILVDVTDSKFCTSIPDYYAPDYSSKDDAYYVIDYSTDYNGDSYTQINDYYDVAYMTFGVQDQSVGFSLP